MQPFHNYAYRPESSVPWREWNGGYAFQEAAILVRIRNMLVFEMGDTLWLAKATPRPWLEQGKKISVKNAPTYFGTLAYEIVSDVDNGKINATIEMPARKAPEHARGGAERDDAGHGVVRDLDADPR